MLCLRWPNQYRFSWEISVRLRCLCDAGRWRCQIYPISGYNRSTMMSLSRDPSAVERVPVLLENAFRPGEGRKRTTGRATARSSERSCPAAGLANRMLAEGSLKVVVALFGLL